MLFKKLLRPDRQQTQLAYRVKFFPFNTLSESAKDLIVWSKLVYMRKKDIEDNLNEDKTKIIYRSKEYVILWAYNNIPTQKEWEGKSESFNIRCEFRASPAIPEYAVCILNFELNQLNAERDSL